MTTFNEQFNELVKVTLSERQKVNYQSDSDKNIQVMDESAKGQDFFQDNNTLGKRYITMRIKSRNFSSNSAYVKSTRKIITMKILFLMSTCLQPNI